MQKPLLIAWYAAARHCPDTLTIPAIDDAQFLQYFSESAPLSALWLVRPQHWSLLSQMLWDCVFSTACVGCQHKLRAYCTTALAHINRESLAGTYDWSPIHHVYDHPFIPILVPTNCRASLKEFLWQDYPSLATTFPEYMAALQPVALVDIGESTSRVSSPTHESDTLLEQHVVPPANALGNLLAQHCLEPRRFHLPRALRATKRRRHQELVDTTL
jgi:hypothetical protein